MEEQLMRPYMLFRRRFPDMMYEPESIRLWNVTEEGYEKACSDACRALGIPHGAPGEPGGGEKRFCAEVLKADGRAIILLNSVYREMPRESDRIIVHELSHLYYDLRSGTVEAELARRSLDERDPLSKSGARLWREFAAKHMTALVIGKPDEPERDALRREFRAMLYHPDALPERLGFFLANQPEHQWDGDVADVLALDRSRPCCAELTDNLRNALDFLRAALSPQSFFDVDRDFLIALGKMIAQFAYYYLSYFELTDRFIGA